MSTFWIIYFVSVGISTVLTIVNRKQFKQHLTIGIVLCFIPIVTSIWAFALIASCFERKKKKSNLDYYLMYSKEHETLFIYNEEQHENYVEKELGEIYECVEFFSDSEEIIKYGLEEAKKRNCYFNSKFKMN